MTAAGLEKTRMDFDFEDCSRAGVDSQAPAGMALVAVGIARALRDHP